MIFCFRHRSIVIFKFKKVRKGKGKGNELILNFSEKCALIKIQKPQTFLSFSPLRLSFLYDKVLSNFQRGNWMSLIHFRGDRETCGGRGIKKKLENVRCSNCRMKVKKIYGIQLEDLSSRKGFTQNCCWLQFAPIGSIPSFN